MPQTIHPTRPDPNLELLERTLQRVGYGEHLRVTGYPSRELWETVALFQAQHVGPDGQPLSTDQVVGNNTWWALANPSGPRQRSRNPLAVAPAAEVTAGRGRLLQLLSDEYARDVFETPDGSNRSPAIDGYWGDTGLLGLPWCQAFASTMLLRALGRHPLGRHHTAVHAFWTEALKRTLVPAEPRPGHLFVLLTGVTTGHVGFVSAVDPSGDFATFEGNCGNRIKHGRRHVSQVTGWVDVFQDGQASVLQLLSERAESVVSSGTR